MVQDIVQQQGGRHVYRLLASDQIMPVPEEAKLPPFPHHNGSAAPSRVKLLVTGTNLTKVKSIRIVGKYQPPFVSNEQLVDAPGRNVANRSYAISKPSDRPKRHTVAQETVTPLPIPLHGHRMRIGGRRTARRELLKIRHHHVEIGIDSSSLRLL